MLIPLHKAIHVVADYSRELLRDPEVSKDDSVDAVVLLLGIDQGAQTQIKSRVAGSSAGVARAVSAVFDQAILSAQGRINVQTDKLESLKDIPEDKHETAVILAELIYSILRNTNGVSAEDAVDILAVAHNIANLQE